jgi:uncharacterized membrane protein YdbT with pleckstrin-like domain
MDRQSTWRGLQVCYWHQVLVEADPIYLLPIAAATIMLGRSFRRHFTSQTTCIVGAFLIGNLYFSGIQQCLIIVTPPTR